MLNLVIGLLFAVIIVIGMMFVRSLSADAPQRADLANSDVFVHAGEKTIEELRSDPQVKEVEILGTTRLRATYENGEVKIYQRSFD